LADLFPSVALAISQTICVSLRLPSATGFNMPLDICTMPIEFSQLIN
jgi:hypothetical protein